MLLARGSILLVREYKMEPTRLLRLSRSYVAARALQLAVSKDLFSYLANYDEEGRSWKDIGGHLGFRTENSFRGTQDFLDLLVSIDVLQRTGGPGEEKYANSPEAAAFLVRGAPQYVGGYIHMEYNRTFPHMIAMEEALSRGRVSPQTRERLGILDLSKVFGEDPEAGAYFARAMSSVAVGNFRALAQKFDFSRYSTLTDIGGSLATLSLEVCRAHPHLTARSCDLPTIRTAATENVAALQLANRVEVVDLDMFSGAPFPPSDVISMSQILHDWGLPKKMLLIRKAYEALPLGGALLVVERMIDEGRRENSSGLGQSLVMLLEFGEENAFDFTFSEFQGWAGEAGFTRFEQLQLLPDWGAAIAYK